MAKQTVSYIRKELKAVSKLYDVIRDCIGGEQVVKSKGIKYLPAPNDGADAKESSKRYDAYKTRAVFYGVTKRTIDGFIGQIFMRAPVVELPPELSAMLTDGDGMGVSLEQLASRAARFVVGYGRSGILVDYPNTGGAVTKAQIESLDIRPIMTIYAPEKIINWRTITRGARTLLSLVVLEEPYTEEDDGFEPTTARQWRVLRLTGNQYTVEILRENATKTPVSQGVTIPLDASGNPFNEIPFTFIGSENNDSLVDDPPMYDIAALNIAHYRNSADYEESVFLVGQPTPVFMGLTEDWVKNVLKGQIYLGARGSISLPAGADAKLLQASPNSMPLEAMQHKEKQMVALGARVVEKRAVVRTASEANIDHNTESSVLASVAKNVAAAVNLALVWAAKFAGADANVIKFALNTDFDIAAMSAEDRRQLIQEWQSGAIAFEELRDNLTKSGIATLDVDKARKIIDEELSSIPGMTPPATGAPSGTTA